MYEVRENFKTKFGNNLLCPLCQIENDSQEHLLKCRILKHMVKELRDNDTIKYEDIFDEDVDKVTKAADLLIKVTEERDFIIQVFDEQEDD